VGAIHFSLDAELVSALRRELVLDVFVETGTFNGDTAELASGMFNRVITIELSSKQYAIASARLSNLRNVTTFEGNSPAVLKSISQELSERSVLYWLDAHWCGGITAGSNCECPLMDELNAIGSLNDNSVVLIDDARFFISPPPAPHQLTDWPALPDVIRGLQRLNPAHNIWIINDVIVFYPKKVERSVIEYGRTKGYDLLQINKLAQNATQFARERDSLRRELAEVKKNVPSRLAQSQGSGLNALINNRSERLFAHHLQIAKISRVLDIGSNSGQFAKKIRDFGYRGIIYSVEPLTSAHSQLVAHSRPDPRWIPLPRQGVGDERAFLDLHVSENSWSSSLLSVGEEHLRAAPSSRAVGDERVFINAAFDLLQADIMDKIEAVKIDVQGYESRVLDGYMSRLSSVRLILLEMSMVECYVGAPKMLDLDRRLVNDLGFSRISLEPSYYDEIKGIAQQFDGLYFKPDFVRQAEDKYDDPRLVLFTSTGGAIKRFRPDGSDVGPAWQNFCVKSWKNVSSRVISVSENKPPAADVEWRRVPDRPRIAQLFRAMGETHEPKFILSNSDIAFTEQVTGIIPQLDSFAVYYGQRAEVEVNPGKRSELTIKETFAHGFDYFVLPRAFVDQVNNRNLLPDAFRVGEPWWDYAIPILAASLGFPAKRLANSPALALHFRHDAHYTREKWLENGREFLAFVDRVVKTDDCRAVALCEHICRIPGTEYERLNKISQMICSTLP
jgi:FkbM family methyltransferase